MVFAIVLTMPFLSLVSGAMTEKTLYADMPVEWAVSYDPRTDASDLVPESDIKHCRSFRTERILRIPFIHF